MDARTGAEIAMKAGATIGEVIDKISRERDSARAMVNELVAVLEAVSANYNDGYIRGHASIIKEVRSAIKKAKG